MLILSRSKKERLRGEINNETIRDRGEESHIGKLLELFLGLSDILIKRR